MAHIFSDTDETDIEINAVRCKQEVENAFHALLVDLGKKGWHPAEVAMALADIAEEYIMAFPIGPSLRN